MSLKDDIELIRSMIKYQPPTHPTISAQQALSRIESALALDDGPPQIGDIVYTVEYDDDGEPCNEAVQIHSEMFRNLLICQRSYVMIMRANEVERRIKEVGK